MNASVADQMGRVFQRTKDGVRQPRAFVEAADVRPADGVLADIKNMEGLKSGKIPVAPTEGICPHRRPLALCQLLPPPKASAQMVSVPKVWKQTSGAPSPDPAVKRRNVVWAHKRQTIYLAYASARPMTLRDPDEPMTPNTDESMPKRVWETRMQKWRQGLRKWYAENIEKDDQDDVCVVG